MEVKCDASEFLWYSEWMRNFERELADIDAPPQRCPWAWRHESPGRHNFPERLVVAVRGWQPTAADRTGIKKLASTGLLPSNSKLDLAHSKSWQDKQQGNMLTVNTLSGCSK